MFLTDRVSVSATRRTADGYLVADVKVARTGIQNYLGSELGRDDLPVVRVYRPESEVFATDAMHSYAYRPVTVEHPSKMVTADTWKALAAGQTGGEVVRDGEFVRVPLVLMDAAAIKAYQAGKRELSMGYTAEIVFEDGVTPDGEAYDAIQTNLRMNHLALVDRARGGDALRIGDSSHIATAIKWLKIAIARHERHMDGSESTSDASQKKMMGEMRNALKALTQDDDMKMDHLALVDRARGGEQLRIGDRRTPGGKDRADNHPSKEIPMSNMKTVLVDGLSVETTDAGAQAIAKLQAQVKDGQTALADAQAAHATTIAAKDAEIARKDAEIDNLKGKVLTDADIDARVKARGDLIADAKLVAPNVDFAGKADGDIRRAAVVAVLGDAAIAGKPDAYVQARFDIAVEDAKKDPVRRVHAGGAHAVVKDNGYQAAVNDLDYRTRNQKREG